MLAFHNNPEIKAKFLERIESQIKKGLLRAGLGWDSETKCGCVIGSTICEYDHLKYADETGIPVEIAHLEDSIFEGLANDFDDDRHLVFAVEFIECIEVGADLSLVTPKFMVWLLDGDDSPIPRNNRNHKLVKDAIDGVAALHREWIETRVKPERERFEDAEARASNAAWVARAGGAEGAARVAWVARAARAAETSWVSRTAWAAAHQTMKDKFIELLSEAH